MRRTLPFAPVTRFASLACAALLVAALSLAVACGSSGSQNGGGPFEAGAPDSTVQGDGGPLPNLNGDSSNGAAVSLAISPAASTLTVTSLAAPFPTATLAAMATFANGAVVATQAAWTIDRIDIATIDPNGGTVSPGGGTFGVANVTATAAGLTAKTTITVKLVATIEDAGLTPPQEGALSGATTIDPAVATFAYPYDQTVFPRGLLPPALMWNGGAKGDAYLVHLVGPSFDLSIFTAADPPSGFTMPASAWNALTTSAAGSTVQCVLHRLSAGIAYASAQQTWTIADANLGGTIYYWEINEGQLVQIDLGTGTRGPVFDAGPSAALGTPVPLNSGTPASPPWEDNGSGNRCVACHSVSKNGNMLTSVFSRAGSQGPLGFYNFSTGAVQAISDYTQSITYDALSPDGTRAVANFTNETMGMIDTSTGSPIASTLDGIANLCDPTFSPDGTLFALSQGCTGGGSYPVEFDSSNLQIYAFNAAAAPYFTSPQTVLTGAGTGDAIAFPAFSPDSKFLFYQRGSYSRAKYGTNQHGIDDLYVAAAKAGATQIALDAANGKGVLPADSQHLNYAPTVNPIASGGYVWIVFTTPRDYGNVMVSPQGAAPNDATYTNHKQLWVTAVNANVGTTDPSHPAFWLPGQNEATANFFGYWALAPCKPTPTDGGAPPSCTAGFECCSGYCRDTDAGPACATQPAGCALEGDKCTLTSDCCGASSGIQCIGGICQATAPK